jgi:branched-chain amino acid transport system permease protein
MCLIQALVNGLIEGSLLSLVALGMTLVFGISKFPNAAHGDYLTVGAYGAYFGIAFLHLSIPLAAFCGILVTVITGLIFYYLVFRKLAHRSSATKMIASIGIALFLRHFIIFFAGTDQYTYGLPILRAWKVGGLRIFPMDLIFTALSVSGIIAVHLVLRYTDIGRKMRAVSDNSQLASISGIRAGSVNLIMWTISLSLAGFAGILLGSKMVVDNLMGWDILLPAFAAAILGGLGSPYGAILGGIIIGISQELAVLYISETYKVTFSFIVIGLVLLIRPSGIAGHREAVR